MNELISSVLLLRLEGWLHPFHARIRKSRDVEMRSVVGLRVCDAANQFFGTLTYACIPVVVFAWFAVLMHHDLDPTTAFTTLSWLTILQWSVRTLPYIYSAWALVAPTLDRLCAYLYTTEDATHDDAHEQHTHAYEPPLRLLTTNATTTSPVPTWNPTTAAVSLRDCTLAYDATQCVLRGVSIDVYRDELMIICGKVGSGKSTLLKCMCGALRPLHGTVNTYARTRAYVSQKPFLLNATVKENVTFGKPFEAQRFERCIELSCLRKDMHALANGVHTRVGDAGVQLSGGQRTRIALARALYSEADVIFLDDVLSAVDAHTRAYLWEHTIVGHLRRTHRRSVVLVTHQVQYAMDGHVDRVVALQGGAVACCGPWGEVHASIGEDMKRYMSEASTESDTVHSQEERKEEEMEGGERLVSHVHDSSTDALVSVGEVTTLLCDFVQRYNDKRFDRTMVQQIADALSRDDDDSDDDASDATASRMQSKELRAGRCTDGVEEEEEDCEDGEHRSNGVVTLSDALVYLRSFGTRISVVSLACAMALSCAMSLYSNVWLAEWTNSNTHTHTHGHSQQFYVSVYALLCVGQGLTATLKVLVLTWCSIRASRAMHTRVIARLLTAPMSFFDTNPNGRILNRFLTDMASIDVYVPDTILTVTDYVLTVASQVILIVVYAPWIMLSVPLLAAIYTYIFNKVCSCVRSSVLCAAHCQPAACVHVCVCSITAQGTGSVPGHPQIGEHIPVPRVLTL